MTNRSELRDTKNAAWRAVARVTCLALVALSSAAMAPVGASVVTTATPLPHLVKDIWPGAQPEARAGSSPNHLTNARGTLFFQAWNGIHGALWKSDGTRAGTVLIKDIRVGDGYAYIRTITASGRTVYFTASWGPGPGLPHHGLWKSDGTPRGTVLVKTISSRDAENFQGLINVAGTLFFASGGELWKTDGTRAGTVRVKDINPHGSSHPANFMRVGRTLYFTAIDGSSGQELWKSDGTRAGTVRVKDINPHGSSGSSPIAPIGRTLLFSAVDGTHGRELWKTDGTRAGTVLVKDIVVGGSSSFGWAAKVGQTLFFTRKSPGEPTELWKSDGTAVGTALVRQITASRLLAFRGLLYFLTNEQGGYELWRSDGTPIGTIPAATLPGSYGDGRMVSAGNTLYCVTHSWPDGAGPSLDLWASDGTAAGTTVIMTSPEDDEVGQPLEPTRVGHDLFVQGYDPVHGFELWVVPPA